MYLTKGEKEMGGGGKLLPIRKRGEKREKKKKLIIINLLYMEKQKKRRKKNSLSREKGPAKGLGKKKNLVFTNGRKASSRLQLKKKKEKGGGQWKKTKLYDTT